MIARVIVQKPDSFAANLSLPYLFQSMNGRGPREQNEERPNYEGLKQTIGAGDEHMNT